MKKSREKYRIFYRLEEHLEIPMFLLALVWLYLFIIELISGLSPTQEKLISVIWILFILEFLIKLLLAPRRFSFLRDNWITLVALLIPAFRMFRFFRAIRLLGSVRVINSTRVIRALTSGRRFFSALKEAQGPQPTPEMNVGILIAQGKADNKEALLAYAGRLAGDVKKEMQDSTGMPWHFDLTDITQLANDDPQRPSAFLDEASLRMAEGPYDLVTVITDVGLMSRKNHMVPGLSSPVSRIMVISTRKLTVTGRNKPLLELDNPKVRHNTAALFLHLAGQLLGLKASSKSSSRIMGMKTFNQDLQRLPSFSAEERAYLQKNADRAPDRELREGNALEALVFHILMTLRHPAAFLRPLIKNRALLLPLSLPSLATAAVAPALLLVFTAEIWDVGLGMTNGTATFFAIASVMLASFYLVRVQALFLPRKEKRIVTEHLAVANSVIYFSVFLACIGLFLLVGGLMMVIEIYVFPEGLMDTWPTLEQPAVNLADKIRLAAFISTVGVTTGALAGGLESRTLIQHLALFRGQP